MIPASGDAAKSDDLSCCKMLAIAEAELDSAKTIATEQEEYIQKLEEEIGRLNRQSAGVADG